MTTPQLPERPNLEQLKRQAKDLLHAAQTDDPAAIARFRALPAFAGKTPDEAARMRFALHDAQSVIAREYGFASWNVLRERVEELTLEFADAAREFVRSSLDPRIGRAERILAQHPGIVTADFHAALVFGNVDVVRSHLARTPALATASGGPLENSPLVYVANSRWAAKHSAGLLEIARLLLAGGASPNTHQPWAEDPSVKLPVLWAALCQSRHLALGRLLLESGAEPNDGESTFHSAENGDLPALELLAARGAHVDGGSGGERWGNTPLYFILHYHAAGDRADADVRRGVTWLLEHGANPNRVCGEGRESALHAAAQHWDDRMVAQLLAHGADVHLRRRDGRTALTLALMHGRNPAAEALRAAGAIEKLSREERFFAACHAGNRAEALALRDPAFIAAQPDALQKAMQHASTAPLETMLACGFDPNAAGSMGETTLHWAAFAGNAAATRVLLAHGVKLDALDRIHHADALGWCDYASSCGLGGPNADFAGVARALFEAGTPLPTPERLDRMGSDAVKAVAGELMRRPAP